MPEIQFEEEPRFAVHQKATFFQKIVLNSRGIIKTERQAQIITICFIVTSLLGSVFLISTIGNSEAKMEAPPGKIIERLPNQPPRLIEVQ